MSIIRQQHYYFLSLNIEYTQCEMYALHFIARGTKKNNLERVFFLEFKLFLVYIL